MLSIPKSLFTSTSQVAMWPPSTDCAVTSALPWFKATTLPSSLRLMIVSSLTLHSTSPSVISKVGFFPADEPKYTAIVTIWSGLTSQNFYGGHYPAAAFKEIVDAVWSLEEEWGEEVRESGSIPSMKSKYIEADKKSDLPVPDLKGMGLKDAIYTIENNGYRCSYEGAGHVVSQSPAAGTKYNKGQTIRIVLK